MELTRSSGVAPILSVRAVVVGAVLVLLAGGAPASGQALQADPADTGRSTRDIGLVLPAPVNARLAWVQRSMVHSGLQKLERVARPLAPRIASGADLVTLQREAEQGLDAVFSAAGLAGIDASELALLILAMAAEDMDDDLRLIMAEMNATAAAKQKLRGQIRELEDRIAAETAKIGRTSTSVVRDKSGAALAMRPGAAPVQSMAVAGRVMAKERAVLPLLGWEYVRAPVIEPLPRSGPEASAESLRSLLGDLRRTLDDVNASSELISLRLQLTMERRSKFLETLSNAMEKITSTMESLVQNLK